MSRRVYICHVCGHRFVYYTSSRPKTPDHRLRCPRCDQPAAVRPMESPETASHGPPKRE